MANDLEWSEYLGVWTASCGAGYPRLAVVRDKSDWKLFIEMNSEEDSVRLESFASDGRDGELELVQRDCERQAFGWLCKQFGKLLIVGLARAVQP